jgi:NADH-quinone oxidoreductase subunit A
VLTRFIGEVGLFKEYVPILLMLVGAVALGLIFIVGSKLAGPKNPQSPVKLEPFECGVEPVGSARQRFPVRFYLVALIFIVFDIEAVYLFPWAVNFRPLGLFGFVEMTVFIAVLAVGLAYVWKKGALEWE